MPKITEVFAFVVADKDADDEGVPAMSVNVPGAGPHFMPLFGADMARAESMRPLAQHVADTTGKKLTLMRFTGREIIDEIIPGGSK
jgi:hypothetical protein